MRDRFGEDKFNQLKALLERLAKPSASSRDIGKAINKSMAKKGKASPMEPRKLTRGHSRGFFGEGDNEQFIQKGPEISVSDKVGVKGLTKGGFDAASLGLSDRDGRMTLKVYENKAYARPGKVGRASAIQQNLAKNLSALKSGANTIARDRNADRATRKTFALVRDLIEAKRVEILVTGAGGNVTGTTIANARFVNWSQANSKTAPKTDKPASNRPSPAQKPPAQQPAKARSLPNSPSVSPVKFSAPPSRPIAPNAAARKSSPSAPPSRSINKPLTQARAGASSARAAPPKSPATARSRAASEAPKRSGSAKPTLPSGKTRPTAAASSREKPMLPSARQLNTPAAHQQHRDRPVPPSRGGVPGAATATKFSAAPAVPKSPTSLAAALSPKGSVTASTPASMTVSPALAPGKPKM